MRLLIWSWETERESHPELRDAELFHSGAGQRKQLSERRAGPEEADLAWPGCSTLPGASPAASAGGRPF